MSNYNIFIEGDRNLFISKTAVDNFKKTVKLTYNTDKFDLNSCSKFLKSGYKFNMDVSNSDLKFTIIEIADKKIKLLELREKIKMKTRARTKYHVKQAKNSGNVPDEIIAEYDKLTRHYPSIPIPAPTEILEKPEEYRGVIKMVQSNQMMKTLPKSHPYVKYFTLLAKAIGVDENTEIQESDMPEFPENVTWKGVSKDKPDFSMVDNDKLKDLLMNKIESSEKQVEQTSKLALEEANTDTEDEDEEKE